MRTIEQAEKDCYAAWAAQPDATHGWCVHHGIEWEELTEPIANRIQYIIASKSRGEQVCRYWVTLLSHRSGSLSFGTVLALNNSKIWNVIGGVEYDFA